MQDQATGIYIAVSVGEVLDRISILEIKQEKAKTEDDLKAVTLELTLLNETLQKKSLTHFLDDPLYKELKVVNRELWDICDVRREQDKRGDFGEEFMQYSRREYKTNDKRAQIKKKINQLSSSYIQEVKIYD